MARICFAALICSLEQNGIVFPPFDYYEKGEVRFRAPRLFPYSAFTVQGG